jgi:hypothetical protein
LGDELASPICAVGVTDVCLGSETDVNCIIIIIIIIIINAGKNGPWTM